MFCSKCGTQVADTAAFCPNCGQTTGSVPAAPRGIPLAPGGGFVPPSPETGSPPPIAPPIPAPAYPGYAAAAPARAVAYAGFWLRFVAYIIDALILGIPFAFVFISIFASSGLMRSVGTFPPETPDALVRFLGMGLIFRIALAAIVLEWLYYALMESSAWQATLGKKALGIYVTDLTGTRISFGRASGRFFSMILFRIIPLIGILLLFPIDCICAGLTEKKQALHDMMAGCLVIRKI
ncbi:MAG: RDD family protein [Candidatus Acidiferrales bacterium]